MSKFHFLSMILRNFTSKERSILFSSDILSTDWGFIPSNSLQYCHINDIAKSDNIVNLQEA